MSNMTLGISQVLENYIHDVTVNESDILKVLRTETAKLTMSRMQISPEQGQLMALLVKLINAKRIIEVGVFTGYSSLCMASSLPEDGKIIACDVSDTWTNMAKPYWEKAGVNNKIDLRLAPANDTLENLRKDGLEGSFDMAFIDADKENYMSYYEHCLALLRTGGLMLVDNTLWSGQVADPSVNDEATVVIRELNAFIAQDKRVISSLVTVGDGLTLVVKL